tara:strand:+ start:17314 stop:19683 length:2370 start_codon:yes stop_codon:yes gene_type:complete
MIRKTFILLILSAFLFSATINFNIDMNNSIIPNEDYNNVVINGSWNNWQGWGITLSDDDGDGIYQGSIELGLGIYEYVIAGTGSADNWSGWGQVINAPIGGSCDWNPNDQWANYGFSIIDSESEITNSYCAGSCNPFCMDDNLGESILLNPPNNAFTRSIHVPFEWEQIPNAISYNLQITNVYGDSMFDNDIVLDTLIQDIIYINKETIDWDNDYWWRIRPVDDNENIGEWSSIFTFRVGSKKYPERDATIYNQELIQDGLIAFGGFGGNQETDLASVVIDQYGNEIWNDAYLSFMLNHINEYGNVYGMSNVDWPSRTGSKISWTHDYDMSFVWSAPMYNDISVDIHEIKQIPNGNYMAFVPDYTQLGPIHQGDWTFLFQAVGYQADGITNEFPYIGMRIVEWDEDGNEVWNWNPFDHFTMQDTDLYGGFWWQAFDQGIYDWMHSNAFHFDGEESVIYVSHRHLSRISKIAYPSGDVIWNMGMPDGYGTGSDNICTELGFSFQHNIQLMDDGTLLFFDNGNISPMLMGDDNPTTRIRRVRVVDNSYCQTEWEYELPANLFGAGMGSVQLLDNGNYLIYTYGNGLNQGEPTLREITQEKEVIWNYQGINNAAWYRTYKIPSLHPEVFSVVVDDYTQLDNDNVIEFSDSINFTITNHSGYDNTYKYVIMDLLNGEYHMFNYEEGEISISPYNSYELSFSANQVDISSSSIMLSIWPVHHEYAVKELTYIAVNNIQNNGDVNQDGLVNILDVVVLVNIVLENSLNLDYADLNNDGEINVIDIVMLVNQILEN